ncbi:hypothetical protein [Schleiferilactobacillus shenzhenensis]|uniref:hypothetical protein n=1 Tax=Schleiferilactobacillus shenzhenensis TaxID=1231337 RepID=UPI00058CA3C4|nr:hypothetical protein [Schleiferilactobacillus shenzhenensis]
MFTGGALILFIHMLGQQRQYVAQYKADIQFNIVRRRKRTDAVDKQFNTWMLPQLRNEQKALHSPKEYAEGFAKSLNALAHPKGDDNQPAGLRKHFSTLVVLWAKSFGGKKSTPRFQSSR